MKDSHLCLYLITSFVENQFLVYKPFKKTEHAYFNQFSIYLGHLVLIMSGTQT